MALLPRELWSPSLKVFENCEMWLAGFSGQSGDGSAAALCDLGGLLQPQ